MKNKGINSARPDQLDACFSSERKKKNSSLIAPCFMTETQLFIPDKKASMRESVASSIPRINLPESRNSLYPDNHRIAYYREQRGNRVILHHVDFDSPHTSQAADELGIFFEDCLKKSFVGFSGPAVKIARMRQDYELRKASDNLKQVYELKQKLIKKENTRSFIQKSKLVDPMSTDRLSKILTKKRNGIADFNSENPKLQVAQKKKLKDVIMASWKDLQYSNTQVKPLTRSKPLLKIPLRRPVPRNEPLQISGLKTQSSWNGRPKKSLDSLMYEELQERVEKRVKERQKILDKLSREEEERKKKLEKKLKETEALEQKLIEIETKQNLAKNKIESQNFTKSFQASQRISKQYYAGAKQEDLRTKLSQEKVLAYTNKITNMEKKKCQRKAQMEQKVEEMKNFRKKQENRHIQISKQNREQARARLEALEACLHQKAERQPVQLIDEEQEEFDRELQNLKLHTALDAQRRLKQKESNKRKMILGQHKTLDEKSRNQKHNFSSYQCSLRQLSIREREKKEKILESLLKSVYPQTSKEADLGQYYRKLNKEFNLGIEFDPPQRHPEKIHSSSDSESF